MKNIFVAVLTAIVLFSCGSREKDAIDICQKSRIQFHTNNEMANLALNIYGLSTNATWLDLANMLAKNEPNKKYEWQAEGTEDKQFYIVAFVDSEGWGHRWEVDIDQKIVKSINQDNYLARKYGLSRFGGDSHFEVSNVEVSRLTLIKPNRYSYNSSESVSYVMKASVTNKTDKTITNASIDGHLDLIFKDKTVSGQSSYTSGFKNRISKERPWEPNTSRTFYIETRGIEKIYLKYVPEYVVFNVSLKAEDPVGFKFDKDIADMDLKEKWKVFRQGEGRTKAVKYGE